MEIIPVPRNDGEVGGFLKGIHDAFASEEPIVFGDTVRFGRLTMNVDRVRGHTIATRILCGFDGRKLWAPIEGRPVAVKSRTTKSGMGLYIGRHKITGIGRFKKRLREELEDGKSVKFGGEAHTEIAKAFKSEVVRRYITDAFISMMERGELPPWQRPWEMMRPTSYFSGLPYKGINAFNLALIAQDRGYDSPYWITAHRAQMKEIPVKDSQRQRGTIIVHVKVNDQDERVNMGDDNENTPPPISFFYHTVFNLNQCVGTEKIDKTRILPEAQSVIDKYIRAEQRWLPRTLKFHEGGNRAYYRPSEDRIVVPPRGQFPDLDEYYMTVFHEIAHSTGHYKRCDRRDGNSPARLETHERGKEELIAEMTASLLSAETDLDFNSAWGRNAASYIEHWLGVIKGDPNMLIWASHQATTAVEYILNRDGARQKMRDRAEEREKARAKKKEEQERKRQARARKRR